MTNQVFAQSMMRETRGVVSEIDIGHMTVITLDNRAIIYDIDASTTFIDVSTGNKTDKVFISAALANKINPRTTVFSYKNAGRVIFYQTSPVMISGSDAINH